MSATVQIGTLRVRAAGVRHGSGLRARLTASLVQSDLHPPGLPPGSILVVRRLGDPLPRRVLVGANARLNHDWQSKTREALVRSYRGALRPADGPVPAGAMAVVFADEGEMLACLLKDAVKREGPGRWWWRYVERPGNTWDAAAIAGGRVRWIPAAFTWLMERGEVSTVLAAIDPVEADRVRRAMLAAFDICPVSSSSMFSGTPAVLEELPAWMETLFSSAAGHGLGLERERLVITALLLYRDPAVLRSPEIQRAILARPAAYVVRRNTAASSGEEGVPEILEDGARAAPFERGNASDARADPVEGAEHARGEKGQVVPHLEDGVQTGLGGILFLIHLLRVGTFASWFADSGGAGAPMNGWEILDAIARGLLAEVDGPLLSDPIWFSLAQLAGRDPDNPLGGSLPRDRSWPPPAAWIAFVSETPRDTTPPGIAGPLCERMAPALRDWLSVCLPTICQHLSRVLRIDPEDVPATLLIHSGRLYITRTHVDLQFPLSSAVSCVRAACLDCDPGWVPFLGRIIRFHFD